MFQKIKCILGKHDRIVADDETCKKNGWLGGIFAPWKCKYCGKESQSFPIPLPPQPIWKTVRRK